MHHRRTSNRTKSRSNSKYRLHAEMLETRLLLCADGLDDHHHAADSYGDLGTFPPLSDPPKGDVVGTSGTMGGLVAATYALTSIPVLNSLPGAAASLYLDFVGHFDASWGGYTNITTPAFDQDGDPTTFSDGELSTIQSVWQSVSEDYAPFKINVTTVQPASLADGVGMLVAIGGNGAWTGATYGGIAYVDSFTNSIANTVFVFSANLSNGYAKYVADAAAHESGHSFGLQHQSQYDASGNKLNEYYTGPGDGTAPIMGNSYSAPRSLWWDGTSSISSTTIQDDMAVIAKSANKFGYRADDYGNTATTAAPLAVSGNQLSGSGIINSTSDVDDFSFNTDAGAISLSVNVLANYNDLDVRLELRDSGGSLIASASPTDSFGATINATVAGGSYRLVVASSGGYGNLGQYTVSGTVIAPTGGVNAPTNLAASVGSGQVNLSWTDNATNETLYEVTRSTDGVTWTTLATLPGDSTSYADASVLAGTTYYYRVRAGNATQMSDYSNPVQVTLAPLPPPAPTGLTTSVMSSSQINLAWTSDPGATSYNIQRSTDGGTTWSQIATTSGSVTTYSNTGLTAKTMYFYRVVAANTGGSSAPGNVASGTTPAMPAVPAAPSSLTAAAASASRVNLSWHDNSTNEDGFRIERSSNGGKSWTQIAQIGANATTFADTSVSGRKSYVYRVRAFNAGGNSAYSNVATVTTPRAAPLPVAAPSSLAAAAFSSHINLAWHDNSDNETGFRIERSTNGGKSWTQIATVNANATTFSDTHVARGKAYSYRVRGFGDAGNSSYTNVAQATVSSAPHASLSHSTGGGLRGVVLAGQSASIHGATVPNCFADASWVATLIR
jgi:fibronectin type 3 domain-containing protein